MPAQIPVELIHRRQHRLHFFFREELLHDQKFRQLIGATLVQVADLTDARAAPDVDQSAIGFASSVAGPGLCDYLAGSLQARFDLAQHRKNVRRVWFLQQKHFTLLQRECV